MPWLVTTGVGVVQASVYVILFLAASAGLGRRLTSWLGLGGREWSVERFTVGTLIGAGSIQIIPFGLGALGVLSVPTLRVALAFVLLLALPDVWAVLSGWWARAPQERPPVWLRIWLLALAPGLLVGLLVAVTPTLDADGLGYHLTVPKRWLQAGALAYLPTYPYSNTPMGVEMLFMNGLAVAGDAAAKITHFALGLVGALALFAAGKRLVSREVAAAAVSAYLFGPFGVGPLLGWAYVEGVTCAALIGAALAWLVWFERRERAWLRSAAVLAGIGVSCKLTAGLFPAALGALTLIVLLREAREARQPLLPVLGSVLALLPFLVLPVLPWLVRAAIVTGNPVFPMGAKLIASRDFSGPLAGKFEEYNRYMVWGVNLHWTLARRKLFFLGTALVLLFGGGTITLLQRKPTLRIASAIIAVTFLVQFLAAGAYKRYWIPILSVFTLPMLALFARQFAWSWVRNALVALTALLSMATARNLLGSVSNDVGGLLRTALGVEPQLSFLRRQLPLYPLYELANRDLPPGGVMMAQYCGGFYLDRPTFCGDIVQESLRYNDFATCSADLRRLGISYVIAPASWALLGSKPAMEGGNVSMLVREGEHACLNQLLREHGRFLLGATDYALFSVDVPSPSP